VLQPRHTWEDKDAYDRQARDLARRFNENFKKYEAGVSEAIRSVAPQQ
jgi:phosphoenolpyruvate carboxykinase (ATP)